MEENKDIEIPEPEPPALLNCLQYFGKFSACTHPTRQGKHIYRFGKMLDCSDSLSEFSSCLMARVSIEEARKEYYLGQLAPKPYETFWELKTTPSWQNEN